MATGSGEEFLLYTATLTAMQPGSLNFVSDPADLVANATQLIGMDEIVSRDLIRFGSTSILVAAKPAPKMTWPRCMKTRPATCIDVLQNDVPMGPAPLTIDSVSTPSDAGGIGFSFSDGAVSYGMLALANFFGDDSFHLFRA